MLRTMVMGTVLPGFLVLAATGAARAQDHSLLLSTSGDAATASGSFPDIDDEEVLIYSPPVTGEPASFLNDFAWKVVLGDANGNGLFDDEPGEVDALHVPALAPVRPTVYDLYVSFSATEVLLDGTTVRDGDVVRILPGGGGEVLFDETFFETATGTSGVDVDAFTISAAGDLYFSFADAEETTYDSLIQENGGSSTLEDGTILMVPAGEMLAHVFAMEGEVLDMVRHALDVSNSSIGDTQGLAEDPEHPGELWFVVSSTAARIEGTVFSTAGEGTVATLNGGVVLHGETFGFETEEALDALALVPWTKDPLSIELDSADIPPGDAAEVEVRFRRGTPGGTARLLVSPAVLPVLAPRPDPRLSGVGMFFVDTTSRLFRNSVRGAKYVVRLDDQGNGSFRYPSRPIPPGVQRILQVIDLGSLEISDGVVVEAGATP